jgi:hypothetical protein
LWNEKSKRDLAILVIGCSLCPWCTSIEVLCKTKDSIRICNPTLTNASSHLKICGPQAIQIGPLLFDAVVFLIAQDTARNVAVHVCHCTIGTRLVAFWAQPLLHGHLALGDWTSICIRSVDPLLHITTLLNARSCRMRKAVLIITSFTSVRRRGGTSKPTTWAVPWAAGRLC